MESQSLSQMTIDPSKRNGHAFLEVNRSADMPDQNGLPFIISSKMDDISGPNKPAQRFLVKIPTYLREWKAMKVDIVESSIFCHSKA